MSGLGRLKRQRLEQPPCTIATVYRFIPISELALLVHDLAYPRVLDESAIQSIVFPTSSEAQDKNRFRKFVTTHGGNRMWIVTDLGDLTCHVVEVANRDHSIIREFTLKYCPDSSSTGYCRIHLLASLPSGRSLFYLQGITLAIVDLSCVHTDASFKDVSLWTSMESLYAMEVAADPFHERFVVLRSVSWFDAANLSSLDSNFEEEPIGHLKLNSRYGGWSGIALAENGTFAYLGLTIIGDPRPFDEPQNPESHYLVRVNLQTGRFTTQQVFGSRRIAKLAVCDASKELFVLFFKVDYIAVYSIQTPTAVYFRRVSLSPAVVVLDFDWNPYRQELIVLQESKRISKWAAQPHSFCPASNDCFLKLKRRRSIF